MKLLSLLFITAFSAQLSAAEPNAPDTEVAQLCHGPGGSYSPGAIISQDDVFYRCVAAYDTALQRIYVWVRIADATQAGREISIYWQ
jgi:hypothetical protein